MSERLIFVTIASRLCGSFAVFETCLAALVSGTSAEEKEDRELWATIAHQLTSDQAYIKLLGFTPDSNNQQFETTESFSRRKPELDENLSAIHDLWSTHFNEPNFSELVQDVVGSGWGWLGVFCLFGPSFRLLPWHHFSRTSHPADNFDKKSLAYESNDGLWGRDFIADDGPVFASSPSLATCLLVGAALNVQVFSGIDFWSEEERQEYEAVCEEWAISVGAEFGNMASDVQEHVCVWWRRLGVAPRLIGTSMSQLKRQMTKALNLISNPTTDGGDGSSVTTGARLGVAWLMCPTEAARECIELASRTPHLHAALARSISTLTRSVAAQGILESTANSWIESAQKAKGGEGGSAKQNVKYLAAFLGRAVEEVISFVEGESKKIPDYRESSAQMVEASGQFLKGVVELATGFLANAQSEDGELKRYFAEYLLEGLLGVDTKGLDNPSLAYQKRVVGATLHRLIWLELWPVVVVQVCQLDGRRHCCQLDEQYVIENNIGSLANLIKSLFGQTPSALQKPFQNIQQELSGSAQAQACLLEVCCECLDQDTISQESTKLLNSLVAPAPPLSNDPASIAIVLSHSIAALLHACRHACVAKNFCDSMLTNMLATFGPKPIRGAVVVALWRVLPDCTQPECDRVLQVPLKRIVKCLRLFAASDSDWDSRSPIDLDDYQLSSWLVVSLVGAWDARETVVSQRLLRFAKLISAQLRQSGAHNDDKIREASDRLPASVRLALLT
eukprot:c5876_g1_i2.p1 GENE.c5876_g1_i2~~c5876_g1_i2.p1  ORF type:complete len:854 (+),score=169.95 c5876_g1_i2:363-2564(+)